MVLRRLAMLVSGLRGVWQKMISVCGLTYLTSLLSDLLSGS